MEKERRHTWGKWKKKSERVEMEREKKGSRNCGKLQHRQQHSHIWKRERERVCHWYFCFCDCSHSQSERSAFSTQSFYLCNSFSGIHIYTHAHTYILVCLYTSTLSHICPLQHTAIPTKKWVGLICIWLCLFNFHSWVAQQIYVALEVGPSLCQGHTFHIKNAQNAKEKQKIPTHFLPPKCKIFWRHFGR